MKLNTFAFQRKDKMIQIKKKNERNKMMRIVHVCSSNNLNCTDLSDALVEANKLKYLSIRRFLSQSECR